MHIVVNGVTIAILLPHHFGSYNAVVFDKENDKFLVKGVKRSIDEIETEIKREAKEKGKGVAPYKIMDILVCCGASENIKEIILEAAPLVGVMRIQPSNDGS